jgi:Rod binding domain-containing protein
MVQGIAFDPLLAGFTKDANQGRLRDVCAEFESILLSSLLKTMRKSVGGEGLFGKSNESKLVRSMYDENLALGIARARGIGLGEMLFQHIKER